MRYSTMNINEDVEVRIIGCEQKNEIRAEGYKTVCWGCGIRLLLPSVTPIFKCGWCGAISSHKLNTRKSRFCAYCSYAFDRVLVTIVSTLMLLIIGGGSWAVFPVLFPQFNIGFLINVMLTGFLSFNTLFNYCVAASVRAGPVPTVAWGHFVSVKKGALDGYCFCHVCKKPKPPTAHHCRACKACVLDMDHHCPFIGNCVGAANHRSFILFLLFAVISSLYVLVMSIIAVWRIWNNLLDDPKPMAIPYSSRYFRMIMAPYLKMVIWSSLSTSARALLLLYLVAISLSVVIGVGLLLQQQVKQLCDGYTLIDSLQLESRIASGLPKVRSWRNLKKVFGHSHPIFWILPRLHSVTNEEKSA